MTTGTDIGNLPPEMACGLTFHLPMELVALIDAGADGCTIEERTLERLTEADDAGLVDPPLYRWAVDRYRPVAAALLASDTNTRASAFAEIEPIGEGLAGAAFHGLIRLGYAAWQRDVDELARGLAYLRTRRQVLAAPAGNGPMTIRHGDLPPVHDHDGIAVFDLLNLVAGTGVPARRTHGQQKPDPAAVVGEAVRLVRRNPSSIVAVHAVTGLHALCEVHMLLTGAPPDGGAARTRGIGSWWAAATAAVNACSVLVEHSPPEAVEPHSGRFGAVDSIDDLVTASIATGDTHDVKLAVALRRLVTMRIVPASDAVAAGLGRLAGASGTRDTVDLPVA